MAAFTISMSGPFPSGTTITRLGGPNEGGHKGEWYNRFGMDLGVSAGTEVRAAFEANVTAFHQHDPSKDSSKEYGAQIFMRSPNDMMGGFYTHISSVPAAISPGAYVNRGDLLGTVFVVTGGASHLHMALVEIIGGLPGGKYTGVNLYKEFLTNLGGAVKSVTFNQDGTPPTVA